MPSARRPIPTLPCAAITLAALVGYLSLAATPALADSAAGSAAASAAPASEAQAPPPATAAAAPAAAAPVAIKAVAITPDKPGPDTLCQLRVSLANAGDRIVSQLGFRVTVNGQELPVYKNQLFMQRLDPGKTVELRLYNFWSTESSRPAPADGRYKVEVSLLEAQWYSIADEAGTEVWNPLGAVAGLPVTATVTVGK